MATYEGACRNYLAGQEQDRLSNLADDILISILLRLEMKDAFKTSILSRSWRYLSNYLVRLEFDGIPTLLECARGRKSLKCERPNFIRSVNQIVSMHRAPFIDCLKVRFSLDERHADDIIRWVKFAIFKRAKVFELDLSHSIACESRYAHYTFHCNALKELPYESNFSFLTSLRFDCVNIEGESLEWLLLKCHLLESLFVEESDNLVTLNVINSGRLRYLGIRCCWNLKEAVLDAVNLASFEFKGLNKSNVVYQSVPSLVEACLGGDYCDSLIPHFAPITSFRAHLSKLCLDMKKVPDFDIPYIPYFNNVRQLELTLCTSYHQGLLSLRCFVEACPLLHEFEFKIFWLCGRECCGDEESESESDTDSDSSEYDLEDVQHWLNELPGTLPHLQKLELVGAFHYSRHVNDELALALYIIKNAPMLENIICDPRIPFSTRAKYEFGDDLITEASRKCAGQLAMIVPSRVIVTIL